MANTIIESDIVRKSKGYVITDLTAEQIDEILSYVYDNFVLPSKLGELIIDSGNALKYITPSDPTHSDE